ncbi:alpha/beta fold hydrolase [Nocardia brasiliensis]|uniref:Alpha/beta fold hydrolase n=1 Tax=Nocardia brasiliensis TaxID=37326 RepID=A0A6G9XS43_NOCBR|nr:alpha/beta hydrolase [Nocardia brasiliensis]QIS03744.1 alpha/beta fold hydrolase [Nocardia brasiliensis]
MTLEESYDPADAPLAIERSGTGPPLVLVHGGMPASLTWAAQQELGQRWSLLVPSRRGFPPSPPARWQDFLADADDLAELLAEVPGGAHLVGFSYGGIGAVLVAERLPHLVRSLTVIEAPLWHAAQDDEYVRELADLSDQYAANPDDAEAERKFFAVAGVDPSMLADLGEDIRHALEFGRRLRSPREAKPRFETIAEAGVPVLICSGEHNRALDRVCDAVAAQLDAQRVRLPGAGHAVQHAPGFNAMLETFLTAAQQRRGNGRGGTK